MESVPSFDSEKCKAFIEEEFTKSALPSLIDYIKIDNMSKGFYNAEEWKDFGWQRGIDAANHVNTWIQSAGVKGLQSEIISNI